MNLHKTFSTPHGGGGPGAGAVGVSQAPAAVHADPAGRQEGRSLPLAGRARPAADHRPAVGVHGQCRRAAARLRLRAPARPRGHASRRRVRHAQRQLPGRAPARARASISPLPTRRASPRVHRHAEAAEAGDRPHRDRRRQAPARLRLPRADDLLPAAGAGVPADRADRDRGQARRSTPSSTRWSAIWDEAKKDIAYVKGAPYTMPVRRLDDVRAARQLDIRWVPAV